MAQIELDMGPLDTELLEDRAAGRALRVNDFESIKEKRAFERRYLPFLKTVVDFDIACEIGFHQLEDNPLAIKHLLLLKLAPPVTVLRRLDRLCRLGVVTRTRSSRDHRVQELRLAGDVLRLYASYARCGDEPREA